MFPGKEKRINKYNIHINYKLKSHEKHFSPRSKENYL